MSSIPFILAELATSGMPNTVDEYCALAARAAWVACGPPNSDTDFIDAAHGLAQGLLGDAWSGLSETDRWSWIDRCERALRDVAANAPP